MAHYDPVEDPVEIDNQKLTEELEDLRLLTLLKCYLEHETSIDMPKGESYFTKLQCEVSMRPIEGPEIRVRDPFGLSVKVENATKQRYEDQS